ncbi:MAG: threonylcarbamoyl-AMP synthase [Chromatiales bacterium 21-64-14]|nr:MAG: threonylcarbamoyl-AMP synthase [Chromatiales bacterium 21-64-14]HQU15357.1 L-threonylcarbamoyladenylate synthase [Gammaproteobacteria bacterium]
MSQFFHIHPQNPQLRLIHRTADIVANGGIVAYPTDSCYALGCHIGDKDALQRIIRIRRLDARHDFTLVCRDLSEIATYARVEDTAYRLIRSLTPGPYTFLLRATREVPRRLQNPRRKTIGIRVPASTIAQALLAALGEPMMSTSLILPGETFPLTDPEEIRTRLEHEVDAVIDGGPGGMESTTVLHWEQGVPVVLRQGKGDTECLSESAV